MADIILTLHQLEDFFQTLTMQILGIATRDINNALINQDKVRISWQTSGAPAFAITDDITFLQITPNNDPIIQQRDITYTNKDTNYSNRIIEYTRNYSIAWTLYGPNSFDNADKLRNGLFLPQFTELMLLSNLALITNIPSPVRAPEFFDGQWWERSDLTAIFNEGIKRTNDIPFIKSADVQIKESR